MSDKGFLEEYAKLLPFKIPEVIYYFSQRTDPAPCLIFYNRRLMGNALESFFVRKYGFASFIRIDGKTSNKETEKLVHRFQHEEEVKFGLLSSKAAGAGLTLTRATKVFFPELPFDATEVWCLCVSPFEKGGAEPQAL